ncbi:MAG TPA: hypothetical protein VLC09_19890 [Polyangiaceae bacterium]|nr:hypothetical protein [Polyangiaceae bacterium]
MSTRPHLALLSALSLSLVGREAHAETFVLLDETFTFTEQQARDSKPSPSHVYVREAQLNPARPIDWTQPVDYRHGKVRLRLEVLEKPAGDEPTQWSICYVPVVGIGPGYGCTGTGIYQKAGVLEVEQSMTEFWQNDAIDWSHGIREIHLVMKDANSDQGHVHRRSDPERFFPTRVRLVMTQVSAPEQAPVAPVAPPAASNSSPPSTLPSTPPPQQPSATCAWSRPPFSSTPWVPLFLTSVGWSVIRAARRHSSLRSDRPASTSRG